MLHPHAHGEGLLAHGHAVPVQHLQGVPGAVPGGQHQGVAGDLLARVQHRRRHRAVPEAQVGQRGRGTGSGAPRASASLRMSTEHLRITSVPTWGRAR